MAGDAGSVPGSGRSPGGGNGNPAQYSCLESPMDRGARQAHSIRSHRVTQGWTEATQHVLRKCLFRSFVYKLILLTIKL